MSTQPRLIRSIPFWILIVGSIASAAAGTWLVVTKTATMTTTLTDGSATGVEVYAGQAWVTLGAALVGAGLVGLVAALFLGVAKSFLPAAPVEVVEPVAGDAEPAPIFADYAPVADAPAVETAVEDAATAAR